MARSELGTQLRYTGFESGSLAGEASAGRIPSWQLPNGSITGPGFIEQVVQSTFKSSGTHAIKIRVITTGNNSGDTGCRIFHNAHTEDDFIMVADAMIPTYISSNRFYNIFQIKQQVASGGSNLIFAVNIVTRGGNNTGGPMQAAANFGQWHFGNVYNMDLPETFPVPAGYVVTPGEWFRMKFRIKKNTFNGTTPDKNGRFEYWLNFNHAGGFPLVDDALINDYNNIYTNFYINPRTGLQMQFNPTSLSTSINNYAGNSNPATTDVYLDNFGVYLAASDTPATPDPDPDPDPNPPTGEITDGIVSSYRMEENSILSDDTAFNNGTNVNTVIGTGRNLNGLVYNGTDAYSTVPNSTSLTLSDEITMSFDIYPTADGQANVSRIINKYTGDGSNNDVWSVGLNASRQIRFRFYINSTLYDFITTAALTLDTWSRVVVRWKSTEAARISINGTEEVDANTRTGTFTNSTNPLIIGGLPPEAASTGRMFEGVLDNIIIWNRKLTDEEKDTMHTDNPTYLNLIGSTDPELPPFTPEVPFSLSRVPKKIGIRVNQS